MTAPQEKYIRYVLQTWTSKNIKIEEKILTTEKSYQYIVPGKTASHEMGEWFNWHICLLKCRQSKLPPN